MLGQFLKQPTIFGEDDKRLHKQTKTLDTNNTNKSLAQY